MLYDTRIMKTKTLDLITKITPDLLNKKVQWEDEAGVTVTVTRAGLVMDTNIYNHSILVNQLHIYGSTKGWSWFKLSDLTNLTYYQPKT